jgi:hypothetical protein
MGLVLSSRSTTSSQAGQSCENGESVLAVADERKFVYM